MPSLPLSRLGRLFIVAFFVLLIPSLYFFYPDRSTPPSLADRTDHYEAGGIDSEHWRKPVVPNFEDEDGRAWSDEAVLSGSKDGSHDRSASSNPKEDYGDAGSHMMSGNEASHSGADFLAGDVIMPKLENATAK